MSTPLTPPPRPRRLRRSPLLRRAVADVHLHASNLIYPLFVTEDDLPHPVHSMPGIDQLPVTHALELMRRLSARGLCQFLLFGVTPPAKKDPTGSYAQSPDAPVNRTLAEARRAGLPVLLYADLCLCEYTDHGHCGALCPDDKLTLVDNDRTLDLYAQTALAQARAGADVVAPSGMMDNQVAAIRSALDQSSFTHTAILAYSIKYASSLYSPFRDAGQGGMTFGSRQSYQMDYRRAHEWRTELALDIAQGADMVMVKPAATYLDIIHQARQATDLPLAAYHVSGEFSMLHAAAAKGWLDLPAAAIETTLAIKRAGADLIISYFAPDLLDWLKL
ncbi:MAG: porphobilinogen synthase [Phycisphaeraceae bacterium]|nr:porphobilinogen synthase [Phycisphaeraceae bacterium]